MKKLSILISVAIASLVSIHAAAEEIRAITEDGRKVILLADGKWKFDATKFPVVTSAQQPSVYQSSVKRLSVKFKSDDWNLLPKREKDDTNKRVFMHRSLPIYGMVISDEIPASTDKMRSVIINNAQSASTAMSVILDETRQVSDTAVGHLRMVLSSSGLDYVFSNYYYADNDGNIQVVCYTAQPLFFKYQSECQKFMDGLTIAKP